MNQICAFVSISIPPKDDCPPQQLFSRLSKRINPNYDLRPDVRGFPKNIPHSPVFLSKNKIMKPILLIINSSIMMAMALWLSVATSSCNSGKAQSSVSATGSGDAVVKDAQVVIEKMAYKPASITVTKGTKVTWTDKQSFIPHDVVSDKNDLFDSGNMYKNDTFSYTFNDAGTFTYYCSHHKKMHGTVIVK